MSRLPQPGGDDGSWGDVLNDFLSQSLNADGSLKSSAVAAAGGATVSDGSITTAKLADGAVTNVKLDNATQTTLSAVADKYTKPGSGIPSTDLDSATQTDLTKATTSVQSVNSQTPNGAGAVTLAASDIGLGNVNNTADANKPVSTAMQTALNAKANTSSLATVATSGSYTDLSNQPTIPTVADATASTKGIVQLAGDLAGTAAAPALATTTNVNSIISANTTVAGAAQKSNNLSDLASATTARQNLHSAVDGLPAYAPTNLLNRYDAKHNYYNLKGSNTRKLRAALGRSANGGMGQIMIIGDSGGAGCNQASVLPYTFDRQHAWPLSMGKQWSTLGIPVAGTGLVRVVDGPSSADSRMSATGTWANNTGYASSSTNGASLTLTLGTVDFPSISTYTIAEAWYYDTGASTWTISVNGASSGTGFASVTQGNTNTWKRIVVPGVSIVAASTVKITKTSASLTIFSGINCWAPNSGLVVHNVSQSGATASGTGSAAWADTSATGLGSYYTSIAGTAQRTVSDAVFSTGTPNTVTSATANFTQDDVGKFLARQSSAILWDGENYITAVNSSSSITVAKATRLSGTGEVLGIGRTPDCLFIGLGGNDIPAASVSTVITALTSIRNQYPNSDCVLVAEGQKNDTFITASQWETYVAALYTLADTLDIPLFDFRDRVGNYTQGVANGQYGDNLAHMIAGAYVDWGKAMANGMIA